MFLKLSLLSIYLLAFAPFQLSLAHAPAGRHGAVARRYNELDRRGDARLTWYKTGLGACGKTNSPDDPIVALNKPQWDGGSHCFEWITIHWRGKTVRAQIVDMCEGCPYQALDLSNGLFSSLADPVQVGTIYDASWSFGSGGGDDDQTTTTKHTTPKPTPAPASTKPSTTSTSTKSTSTSTHHTTSSTSISSAVASTQTSTSAQPTPTVSPDESIYQLNMAYLNMVGILLAN